MNNELCNYLFVPAERVNVVQTLLLSLECTTRQLVLLPMCKHRHTHTHSCRFMCYLWVYKQYLSVIRVRIMSWFGPGWRALVTGLPRWCRGKAARWMFGSLVTSTKGEPQVITGTIFNFKGESWDFRSSSYILNKIIDSELQLGDISKIHNIIQCLHKCCQLIKKKITFFFRNYKVFNIFIL